MGEEVANEEETEESVEVEARLVRGTVVEESGAYEIVVGCTELKAVLIILH